MAVFTYEALDAVARDVRGTIAADSPREAREKLLSQGLFVESLTAREAHSARQWNFFTTRPGRHANQLSSAVRDLSTLLATGIGLVEAIDTIANQYRGRFQASLLMLREQVAGGISLSDAMRKDPAIYDELTIQMTNVGENAGTLDVVLDRLSDFRERALVFQDKVKTALLYPAIVVLLAAGVSVFLMTVVLPMLLENLVESGKPLPWPTRVLKVLSDTATTYGVWIALGTGLVVAGCVALVRTPRGRRWWHRLLLATPLIGPLVIKQELARTAAILATLMENGIVFVEAADIAGRSTRNVILKDALIEMRERVQTGQDIGTALLNARVFPPVVIQVFTVGQQTGKLEEMLNRLANGYERQVASATTRLAAALEPILIVGLAIVVGFILFATILPILEAGNVL